MHRFIISHYCSTPFYRTPSHRVLSHQPSLTKIGLSYRYSPVVADKGYRPVRGRARLETPRCQSKSHAHF
jgi:hypothetical protein